MPADSVHSYVASQAASGMARHLRAGGQEDFSVDQEMNLYLRHSRVAAPDMFLYRRRPISKPPGAGSYVAPRDEAPELVMDLLSVSTWQNDVPYADDEGTVANKAAFYQACGVAEYWIYEPEAGRPAPVARLKSFRLRPAGIYAAIAPERGRWPNAVLGTAWSLADPEFLGADQYIPLRWLDLQAGAWYPTIEERDRQIGETQGPFGSLPRAIRAFGPASGIKADPILESTLPLRHRSAQEGKTRVENRSNRNETLGHNEAVLPIRRTPWYPKCIAT